jgi:hypothetical protein
VDLRKHYFHIIYQISRTRQALSFQVFDLTQKKKEEPFRFFPRSGAKTLWRNQALGLGGISPGDHSTGLLMDILSEKGYGL